MKFKITKVLPIVVALTAILLASCNETVEYPVEPHLTFLEYKVFSDQFNQDTALVLVMEFTDGDGDIGLAQADTFEPFNSGSKYYFNMYIDYFEFVDSQFTKVTPNPFSDDTISYEYRLPREITPTTNNKSIKGTIELSLNDILAAHLPVKFKIYIYDRALHKSNTIETPPINYYP